VTQDESQVSVGGLLALNQVLRKHLVIFDHFWNFDNLSNMERNAKQILWKLDPFLRSFWVL
jgi:hypothetical protein